MHNPYLDNAYRILGLTTDQEPMAPGQLIELPGLAVCRELSPDDLRDRLMEAGFRLRQQPLWFCRAGSHDDEPLQALRAGNIQGALTGWLKAIENGRPGALQNGAILTHALALGGDPNAPETWQMWALALKLWRKRSQQPDADEVVRQTYQTIVQELTELAAEAAKQGQARVVGQVLCAFRDSELDPERLRHLEESLLKDEVERLQFRAAKVRELYISWMREPPLNVEEQLALRSQQAEQELIQALEWMRVATLPGGPLAAASEEAVAMVFRTEARAWDTLLSDRQNQIRALQKSMKFAVSPLKEELAVEIEWLKGGQAPAVQAPMPQPTTEADEQADDYIERVPADTSFMGTGFLFLPDRRTSSDVRGDRGEMSEGTYGLCVMGWMLIPWRRYRIWSDAPGEVRRARRIQLSEFQIIVRALMVALVFLGSVAVVFEIFSAPPTVDVELEIAGLKARREVLIERIAGLSSAFAALSEKVEKLEKRVKVLQEKSATSADARSQLSGEKIRLEEARNALAELENRRERAMKAANDINAQLKKMK